MCTLGENVKWCGHCKKRVWTFLKKLKRELSYDPTILLLDMYPKELKRGSQKDTDTLMFTATLFTTAKRWKQPNCPSADEWVNKISYIYTVDYYSALRRKEILTR